MPHPRPRASFPQIFPPAFTPWIVAALATIFLSFPVAALANKHPAPTRQMSFCLFPLEPLGFFDENGKAQGFYPDLIRKIAEQESWKPVFVASTFGDCMEGLQRGEYDFMATIAYSEERARHISYSREPVLTIWGQLYIRPGSRITTPADLEGKKIGVMRKDINGRNFKELLRRFGISCEFSEFPTHEEIFRAVHDKRLDAGVAPQHYGLRHANDFNLVGSSIIFSPFPIYFAAPKDRHPEELRRIDSYIKLWKKSANSYYYQRLAYWMGGAGLKKEAIPAWIWLTIAVIAAIAALLVLFNRFLRREVARQTKELFERERQYRELVQNVDSVILRWNTKGEVVFLNTFGQKLFGYTEEEIIGKHVVGTIVAETDQAGRDLKQMIDNILRNPDAYRSNENENICKDGRRVYIQWRNVAITNDNGGFDEILSVGIDITEKKQLERELVQAQKMEAVGTLAGGIAHDFNNILSSIFGFTELAQLKTEDPALKEDLDQVMQAAVRARDLVQQILAFSRKSDQDKAPLKVALQVKEALKLLRASIPTTIDIQHNIVSQAKVMANPTQIHQIIMNLCTNAYHAMEAEGGTLFVSLLDAEGPPPADDTGAGRLPPGEYVVLEVRDTGVGMDELTMARIFDPYFTTKEQGRGTGMGLAVVHGIVNSMNGVIAVDSEPGKGTVFTIHLPVVKSTVALPDKGNESDDEPPPGQGEHIVLVDDEEKIRRLHTTFLTDAGYRVTSCPDGQEAFEALRKKERCDLLITDIAMPQMSGKALAAEARKLYPNMPIIMCTGYNDVINRAEAARLGVTAYVEKPISRRALLRKVHEVLRAGLEN